MRKSPSLRIKSVGISDASNSASPINRPNPPTRTSPVASKRKQSPVSAPRSTRDNTASRRAPDSSRRPGSPLHPNSRAHHFSPSYPDRRREDRQGGRGHASPGPGGRPPEHSYNRSQVTKRSGDLGMSRAGERHRSPAARAAERNRSPTQGKGYRSDARNGHGRKWSMSPRPPPSDIWHSNGRSREARREVPPANGWRAAGSPGAPPMPPSDRRWPPYDHRSDHRPNHRPGGGPDPCAAPHLRLNCDAPPQLPIALFPDASHLTML